MLPVENKYKKCALFWGAILQDILESSRYIHLDDEPSNIVLFTIYKKIASLMQNFRYCI